jgi:uncharacterized membrane protein YheB (UPF0754 family)
MIDSIVLFWHHFLALPDFWGIVSIPIVAATVTWVHVWIAMKMVFYPLEFVGFAKPWLGWQGIVPRKAGKMAGIMADNALKKLGSLSEVFKEMQPEEIARHISSAILDNVEDFIDEIMNEKNRVLWENLPVSLKKRVYAQVRKQTPAVMDKLVMDMGENIEDLMDMRHMVVSHMENDKALVVRMFLEVGSNEVKFVVNASFWIGLVFGVVQMIAWIFIPSRWGLPLYGAALGYLTNWVAINMVFRPLDPITIWPFNWKFQGVFLKRQVEVSEKFAHLATLEMMSIKHIMTEVMTGSRCDRTRALIKRHISPLLEGGVVRTAMQLTVGPTAYAALKKTVTDKAMIMSLEPVQDPQFNRDRAHVIEKIFAERMKLMSPKEFQDLLRPAFEEDEWIVIVMGAIMGFVAGWMQLIFGFN